MSALDATFGWIYGTISGGSDRASFVFEGVSAADAEKLTDMKKTTIQGKVKEASLEPLNPMVDSPLPYYIRMILADVQVDGKAYTPSETTTFPKKRADNLAGSRGHRRIRWKWLQLPKTQYSRFPNGRNLCL
jgi:hypothetical protein